MVGERSILDELDVQRVLVEYAWACDNKDWALLRSVFTADAQLDYSSTRGPAGGREEVVKWLRESLSQTPVIQHVVSNFQIDVSGNRAAGRAMFYTSVRVPGLDDMLITGGYYDLTPPSTGRTVPVMYLEASETRNRATDATS